MMDYPKAKINEKFLKGGLTRNDPSNALQLEAWKFTNNMKSEGKSEIEREMGKRKRDGREGRKGGERERG